MDIRDNAKRSEKLAHSAWGHFIFALTLNFCFKCFLFKDELFDLYCFSVSGSNCASVSEKFQKNVVCMNFLEEDDEIITFVIEEKKKEEKGSLNLCDDPLMHKILA